MTSTRKTDLQILVLPAEFIEKGEAIENVLKPFTDDVNNDGKIVVLANIIPINIKNVDPQTLAGYDTKFMGELQTADAMLYLSNEECDMITGTAEFMLNIKKDYPDNDKVTSAGFMIESEKLKQALGWADIV